MYEIQQQIESISDKLKLACKSLKKNIENQLKIPEDLKWAASHLYAELLLNADEGKFYCIDYKKLIEIQTAFIEEKLLHVSVDELISRDWLRLTYDIISIPKVISAAARDISKVEDLKHELSFLLGIETILEEGIEILKFNLLVEEYERKNEVKLDLEKAKRENLYKDNKVVIKSKGAYMYKHILFNLSDFKFIKYVYERLHNAGNENKLSIKKEIFSKILSSHKTAFNKTPDVEYFINENKIENGSERWILHFGEKEITNQCAAILWEKVLTDKRFRNDKARLKFWYKRTVHKEISWVDITCYLQNESLLRFVNLIINIVKTEHDLAFGKKEMKKLKLDQLHGRIYMLDDILDDRQIIEMPESNNIFQLYKGLLKIDNEYHNDLLFVQEARYPLTYLIRQLVKSIRTDNNEDLSKLYKLLNTSTKKPFILWTICKTVVEFRQDIIPFLFLNNPSISLGFYLLWELEISQAAINQEDIRLNILKDCFSLILNIIANSNSLSVDERARISFECLEKAFLSKFIVSANQNIELKRRAEEFNIKVSEALKSAFSSHQLPGTYFKSSVKYKPYLFIQLLYPLFNIFREQPFRTFIKNASLSLPYYKLDFLEWILELQQSNEYKSEIDDKNGFEFKDDFEFEICEVIKDIYLEVINCTTVKAWDFSLRKLTYQLPSWFNFKELNERVQWDKIAIALQSNNLFEEFLHPQKLKLEKTKEYSHYNRFTIEKIRTHIAILLLCFNKLYSRQDDLDFKGFPVKTALNKLENQITTYITAFCVYAPERGRMDIFDESLERSYWEGDKQALLPAVGYTINRFSDANRENVIKELMHNGQLIKALKLLEYVTSEKNRETLIKLISSQNIAEYLSTLHSIGDLEYIMQQLAASELFVDKARETLTYWEDKVINSKRPNTDDYKIKAFRIKLLLAYQMSDESAVNFIKEPSLKNVSSQSNFSASNDKEFYRALINLKNKQASKAYISFNNQLKNANEDKPTLALNRFASKLEWANETEDLIEKYKLIVEALEEWDEFEKMLSKDIPIGYIQENIWYNKLNANSKLNNHTKFDSIYYQLDKATQLKDEFLKLRIENFVARDMHVQAEKLITEAETYHTLNNGSLPKFIYELRKLVNTSESIQFMKQQFLRIFSQAAEQLIEVIPDNLNRYKNLQEFILSELVDAANDILTYINSISNILYEDKYSDLMILALKSRLRIYGWHVGNARGGHADTNKLNPGEIDFAIFSKAEKLTICEAMNIEGKNKNVVEKHNFKIFNYDHSRMFFYMIVYYKGQQDKFDLAWNQYKNDVSSVIKFPEQFGLIDKELEDVSIAFGNNSIRVCKGMHQGDITLYHLFININYKV